MGELKISPLSVCRILLHSLVLIPSFSAALGVTPNSPCASVCGTDIDTTTTDEVVCDDTQFSSTTRGNKFRECVECELASTAVDESDGLTDVLWGIYNLRFALSTCVYGFPEAIDSLSTPCQVTCTSLQPAIVYDIANGTNATGAADLSFCTQRAWADTVINNCVYCYNWTSTERYLGNFMQALHNACKVSLPAGKAFPISATQIFSAAQISAPPSTTSTSHNSGLGSKLKVVIAVPTVIGGLAILTILSCCFLLVRKRRRMMLAAGNMDRLHAGSWNDPNIAHIYGQHQAYPSPPAWGKNSPTAKGWSQPMSPIASRGNNKTGSYYEGWGNTFPPNSSKDWPNASDIKYTDQVHERYFPAPVRTTVTPLDPDSNESPSVHSQQQQQQQQQQAVHPDLNLTIPSATAIKQGQIQTHDYGSNYPYQPPSSNNRSRPVSGGFEYQYKPYSDQSPEIDSATTEGTENDGKGQRQTRFVFDSGSGGWVRDDLQQHGQEGEEDQKKMKKKDGHEDDDVVTE